MSTDTRDALAKKLQELGVQKVTAAYDGSGDSGQVEEPEFGSIKVPQPTVSAVQDLFYDLLEDEYGGWEINEGSYGQFEWNVSDDRINLQHNIRSEEYEERDL
jgi:uncharacterized protein DUF6878